jgi:hypothetical protein
MRESTAKGRAAAREHPYAVNLSCGTLTSAQFPLKQNHTIEHMSLWPRASRRGTQMQVLAPDRLCYDKVRTVSRLQQFDFA